MDTALMWVNIVIWLGIGGYLVFLGACQTALARRCRQLEAEHGDDNA